MLIWMVLQVENWPENLRMKKFLTPEVGGQTVAGESKLGEIGGLL